MLVTYRRTAAKKASHFVIFVAFAALASAVYLAIEAAAWAVLYLWLSALPAWAPAMLYSLEAITSFGHAQIYLGPLAVAWRDGSGQRPHSLWPHDGVSLRRHSAGMAALAGLRTAFRRRESPIAVP
jgi:hypothetical protein